LHAKIDIFVIGHKYFSFYNLFFSSFPADMQISICGTLAALAFEIHLADAPGEAEADIT